MTRGQKNADWKVSERLEDAAEKGDEVLNVATRPLLTPLHQPIIARCTTQAPPTNQSESESDI